MDNIFDSLKSNVFNVIAVTMGYDAVWNGITAIVLFSDPSVAEKVSEHEYEYQRPKIEYREADWQGLKELIKAKQPQIIEIGVKQYYTMAIIGDVIKAKDGAVYTITLQEV